MENGILLVGLAVSGFLLSPIIFQYLNRIYVPVTILSILFLSLNSLAPHSVEARAALNIVHSVPETMMEAVANSQDGLTQIQTEYFNAFH